MVRRESLLGVADNSGAEKVKCIGVFGGFFKSRAKLGDLLRVSIRQRDPHKQFLKAETKVYLAVLVSTKVNNKRNNGHYLRFASNNVILLGTEGKIFGTRLRAPICHETRSLQNVPLLTMARKIV